jgi:hypothetical protein
LLAQGRDLGPTKHAVHQPGENRTGVKAHTPFLPEREQAALHSVDGVAHRS